MGVLYDEIMSINGKKICDEKSRQQLNNIANKKIDDITLSNNVLTLLANSKTIKTITLPTSTTGGGTNGKEIELQKSTTHIQWRYVGDTDWNNLVALNDLRGSDGRGIVSIENTSGMDLDMEYTITYTDGTTDTFWITNGAKGEKGDKGNTGEGVVSGGTTGQILAKKSNTDYDTEWIDAPSGTGGSSEKEWELLQEGEITEEVNVIALTSEKLYSEFLLFTKGFTSKEGTYVTTELGVYVVGAPYQIGIIKNVNTENSLSVTEIKTINGKCAWGISYNKTGTGNAWNPSNQTSYFYEHTQQTSSKIQIKCTNANARITGGIFTLYGR